MCYRGGRGIVPPAELARQDDSKILWMATRHGHADASVACSESGMSRLKPSADDIDITH